MTADIIAASVCGVLGCAILVGLILLCRSAVKAEENRISSGERDERIMRRLETARLHPARLRRIKAIKIVFSVLFYIILLCVVAFCVLASLTARSLGKVKMPYSILAVASGSMSYVSEDNPYADSIDGLKGFDKNSIIFLESVQQSELELYDVIAYVSESDIVIIHRIVEEKRDAYGNIVYTVCGDANSIADGEQVSYDKIIGRYTGFSISGAGAVVRFFNSFVGVVTAVLIVCAVGAGEWASGRILRAERKRGKILDGKAA